MSEKIDVTLEEMQADTRDYILIDVRTEQEFETESLPNAINIECSSVLPVPFRFIAVCSQKDAREPGRMVIG